MQWNVTTVGCHSPLLLPSPQFPHQPGPHLGMENMLIPTMRLTTTISTITHQHLLLALHASAKALPMPMVAQHPTTPEGRHLRSWDTTKPRMDTWGSVDPPLAIFAAPFQ